MLACGLATGIVLVFEDRVEAGVGTFFDALAVAVALMALGWTTAVGVLADARYDLLDARLESLTLALEAQLLEQRKTNILLELLTKRRRRWL